MTPEELMLKGIAADHLSAEDKARYEATLEKLLACVDADNAGDGLAAAMFCIKMQELLAWNQS